MPPPPPALPPPPHDPGLVLIASWWQKCCTLPALPPLMNPQIVTFSCHTAENSMQSKARCQWGLVSTKPGICSAWGCTSWVGCIYFSFGTRPLSRGDLGASSVLTKRGMSRVILPLTPLPCHMALFSRAGAVSSLPLRACFTVSPASDLTGAQQEYLLARETAF